jgi:hypothetical protein
LQRIVLGVGDVCLIARSSPSAHFAVSERQFERGEMRHDISELGGSHAAREPHQFLARHVHVDEHARHLKRRHRHRFLSHTEVNVIARDEGIDHVEVGSGSPIHRQNRTARMQKRSRRIIWALHGAKAVVGIFSGKAVKAQRPLVPIGKALPTVRTAARDILAHGYRPNDGVLSGQLSTLAGPNATLQEGDGQDEWVSVC